MCRDYDGLQPTVISTSDRMTEYQSCLFFKKVFILKIKPRGKLLQDLLLFRAENRMNCFLTTLLDKDPEQLIDELLQNSIQNEQGNASEDKGKESMYARIGVEVSHGDKLSKSRKRKQRHLHLATKNKPTKHRLKQTTLRQMTPCKILTILEELECLIIYNASAIDTMESLSEKWSISYLDK